MAPRETFRLQCSCTTQLLIHTTHLPCSLPCNYVTGLLAYCRWYIRINRHTYCIELLLSIFNSSVKKLPNLEWSFLINDTSWKNKTVTLSTKTFRMVINVSKVFLQTQPFSVVWNEKQFNGKEVAELKKVQQNFYSEYRSYIKFHIAPVILHHPFSLNTLIPTYCHPEETLGHSVFAEQKILFTPHIYIAPHLAIMLQASWHIAEGN